jgi:hypothetical protein
MIREDTRGHQAGQAPAQDKGVVTDHAVHGVTS